MNQFDELPEGWILTELGEITEPSKEKADPNTMEAAAYIGLEHIEKDTAQINGYGSSKDVKSTKSKFDKGDLLYGKLRPYLNKVYLSDIKGVCSTDILVFPRNDNFLNAFLKYCFLSPDFIRYANLNMTGVQHPRVHYKDLAKFSILLPPLNEQRRIVEKIEALTARSRKARAALDEIPALLDQFRQSVLAAAFRGDLTADWRAQNPDVEPAEALLERIRAERRERWEAAELKKMIAKGKEPKDNKWKEKYKEPIKCDALLLPEIPNDWLWIRLSSISKFINGDRGKNYPKKSEYVLSGIPFINTGHIKPDGSLNLESMNYITKEKFESLGDGKIQEGDLIYCLRGATRGKTAFVEPFNVGAIASSLVIIRPDAKWLMRYLYYFLVSPLGKEEIEKYDNGTAQPNLAAQSVAEYLIPLPPAQELSIICQSIEKSMKAIDKLSNFLAQTQANLEQLDQSILAKAFRGELVPQDPNDEPAAVLLDRIRAERERLGSGKKRGKAKA